MFPIQAPADTTAAVDLIDTALNWLAAHPIAGTALTAAAVVLVAYLADVVARRRLLKLVLLVIKRSRYRWDAITIQRNLPVCT